MICGGTIEDSTATATSIALGDKSPTYSRVFVLGLDFCLLSPPWRLIPAPASLPMQRTGNNFGGFPDAFGQHSPGLDSLQSVALDLIGSGVTELPASFQAVREVPVQVHLV